MLLDQIRLINRPQSNHPWISQKWVEEPSSGIAPGTVVDVVDKKGKWVGRGFYNGHARLCLRILTRNVAENIDSSFFQRRIEDAVALRHDILRLAQTTNAYRVIHSEGDGLSGLVVDKYHNLLVIELFSAGMFRVLPTITEVLAKLFPKSQFYVFCEKSIQKQESFDLREYPVPEPVTITENGISFKVAVGSFHKTGFFLDQRDNRAHVAQLARGKRMLDICCHTGGFSIYAAKNGNAAEVIGIDLDGKAIAIANENAMLNGVHATFIEANLYVWLSEVYRQGRQFDLVVLDPSRQTRSEKDLSRALENYRTMNCLAMRVLARNGVLVSCSCSGLVKEEDFIKVLADSAISIGRELQIFHVSGASADHPFMAHVGQSRYLKAVWARVG